MRKTVYVITALAAFIIGSAGMAMFHNAMPAAATPVLTAPTLTPSPEQDCNLGEFYQTCWADGVDASEFRYPVLMRLFLAAHSEYPQALITGYSVDSPIRLELTANGTPLSYCWDVTPMLAEKQLVAGYYIETIERC